MTSEELLKITNCAIWEIDGEFYPVHNWSDTLVTNIPGRDQPTQRGARCFGNANESGVKYVSSSSPTRRAALARIRRAFPDCA